MLLHLVQNDFLFDDAAIVLAVFLGQLRRVEIEVGLADELSRVLAERLAEELIAEREAAVQIFPEDIQRQASLPANGKGLPNRGALVQTACVP